MKERARALLPLSRFSPAWCRVEARLTAPALARYRQMFPEAVVGEGLPFTWKARESTCEVTALDKSAVSANYQGFVQTALCVLMQVHWVNSPFDELPYSPERLEEREGRVVLRTGDDLHTGVYLSRGPDFVVETHTKSGRVLRATYARVDGYYLPIELSERAAGGTQIVVDQIEWSDVRVGGRRMPKALWISVGEEKVAPHSQLVFSECQGY